MASLPDGNYYIVNGYDTSLYMDVSNGSRNNGANVQVATFTGTDAQVFQITTRSDGSRQIASRFTGKCIDVAGGVWENGRNVQMWTDNDTRAQSWDIVDTETTTTIGGTSYSLWQIVQREGEGWLVELMGNSGFTSGTNVCISRGEAADQKWAFIPIPAFRSGGIYKLLLRLDTRYAMSVAGNSSANGASIVLDGDRDAAHQQFYLHERTTGKWTLRNINSGRYVQVNNGTAASLTDVTQWGDSESSQDRWQWNVVPYGTVTVGGVSRQVVKLYSWVTNDGQTYLMDANQHSKLDMGNICICGADLDTQGQYSQEWVLVPTTATDPTMPVPNNCGWSQDVGDSDYTRNRPATDYGYYPTWNCPQAWSSRGPNHYEWRYAVRYLDFNGNWVGNIDLRNVPWVTANVTIEGDRAWVTEGLAATYDSTEWKGMEYAVEVRCIGVGDMTVAGLPAYFNLRAVKEQTVTLSNPGFSPSGLRLDYTNDYLGGTSSVRILSVIRNGHSHDIYRHGNGITFEKDRYILDDSGSFLIGTDMLTEWLSDGDEVIVQWRNHNEVFSEFTSTHSATLTVSYDTGHGATLTPIVTSGEGRTIKVTLDPHYDQENVWVKTVEDGLIEATKFPDGSFYAEYPFGSDIEVWAAGSSSDGDTWGVWHHVYDKSFVAGMSPCHAWNWDGGSFILEIRRDEPLESNYTVESDAESVALNSRPWQSVLLGTTSSGKLSAEGAFGTMFDVEATRAKLEELRLQGHVRYRSPHGIRCNVCVTGYSLSCQRGVWIANVEMVRESV